MFKRTYTYTVNNLRIKSMIKCFFIIISYIFIYIHYTVYTKENIPLQNLN